MSLGLDLGAKCCAGEGACAATAVSASAGAGAAPAGAASNSASSETWSPTFLFFGNCAGFGRPERLSIGPAPSAAAGGCPSAAGAGASPSWSAGSSARLFLGGMVTYTRFANSSPPDYTLAEKRRRPPTYTLERQPPRKLRVYFSALRSRREWAISFFRHL